MENFKYLLPEESGEMSVDEVKKLRKMENRLRELFDEKNYQEMMPPNFEYTDLYRKIGFNQEKMFQFINHEGKSIALRYDFTIPLVRTFALSKSSESTRYSYFGKIYRKEKRHKGRRTESYQIGVELLGENPVKSDQECGKLLVETIESLNLTNTIIEISSAAFYNRLIELAGSEIIDIYKKKNLTTLKKFVEQSEFDDNFKELLLKLPVSSDLSDVEDSQLQKALEEVKTILNVLPKAQNVSIDLTKKPTMSYYTGTMFEVYEPSVANPIISGGRYDELLEFFDQGNRSAIGFCCHMDNLLKIDERSEK